ncbi:hypothetical protein [Candidatus Gromoviella agglomerans]|uniref:hypothetical protein n=1 Tax=Candidatus Gromoviella agglomerans TaxID=2806609 RepID=UPI001E5B4AB4|nr:hypothetical protein [Candidatus Gromoviella agglomerans]UFX98450.1 tRNA-modifying protein YgfZ [Candidatus Gromoviella agglomerans]
MNRSVISICGRDSMSFLQRMVSQKISLNSCYSLLLNRSGFCLYDFFVIPVENEFLIDIDLERSDDFMEHLRKYILSSDVSINKCNFQVCSSRNFLDVGVFIKNEIFDESIYEKSSENREIIAYRDTRFFDMGYRYIIKSFFSTDNLYEFDVYSDYKKRMIENCIPNKIVPEIYTPFHYNLHKLNAISDKKGCYVGQESINRFKNFESIRKRLACVSFKKANENDFAEYININQLNLNDLFCLCESVMNLSTKCLNEFEECFVNFDESIICLKIVDSCHIGKEFTFSFLDQLWNVCIYIPNYMQELTI